MRKLKVSDPNAVRRALQVALDGECNPRFLHRLHGILLIAQGCSCQDVAKWFGADSRTVERWVHAFNLQGVGGLRERPAGGRLPKISAEQRRTLIRELQSLQRAPGTGKSSWTGRRLKQHLGDTCGVDLSLRQCQRILKGLDNESASALNEAA